MSAQLNAAIADYIARFEDVPTIIGMTDDGAIRAINAALKEAKPVAEPQDPAGEVDIFV